MACRGRGLGGVGMSFRVGLLGGQGQWRARGGACGWAGPMAGRGWGLWVGRANGLLGAGLVGGLGQWCARGRA